MKEELSGLKSLEYRDNSKYRLLINNFVTNIRNQLSLDFFTFKYYLSPLTESHLEYLGLVNKLNFTNRLEITNVEHLINVKNMQLHNYCPTKSLTGRSIKSNEFKVGHHSPYKLQIKIFELK